MGLTRHYISQGGYRLFRLGPQSDHKLLWINISHEAVFGDNKAPYRAPAARRLRKYHIRDKNNTRQISDKLTIKNILLQQLKDLEHLKKFHPYQIFIKRMKKHGQISDLIQIPGELKIHSASHDKVPVILEKSSFLKSVYEYVIC